MEFLVCPKCRLLDELKSDVERLNPPSCFGCGDKMVVMSAPEDRTQVNTPTEEDLDELFRQREKDEKGS